MIQAGDDELTDDYIYKGGSITNAIERAKVPYNALVNDYGKVTFTVHTDETRKYLYLVIYVAYGADVVVGDVIEYSNIQVEINDTATDYEPYWKDETEYATDANGAVNGIYSTYPNTTLITDTAGAIIKCSYKKDANKVINDLLTRIAALEAAVL